MKILTDLQIKNNKKQVACPSCSSVGFAFHRVKKKDLVGHLFQCHTCQQCFFKKDDELNLNQPAKEKKMLAIILSLLGIQQKYLARFFEVTPMTLFRWASADRKASLADRAVHQTESFVTRQKATHLSYDSFLKALGPMAHQNRVLCVLAHDQHEPFVRSYIVYDDQTE